MAAPYLDATVVNNRPMVLFVTCRVYGERHRCSIAPLVDDIPNGSRISAGAQNVGRGKEGLPPYDQHPHVL
jgi:hypothetical protein